MTSLFTIKFVAIVAVLILIAWSGCAAVAEFDLSGQPGLVLA